MVGSLAGVLNLCFVFPQYPAFVCFTVRLTVRVLVYKQEQMALNDFFNACSNLVHVQHLLFKNSNLSSRAGFNML